MLPESISCANCAEFWQVYCLLHNPRNVSPFEASATTSSTSSCGYIWKVEIVILRPETSFFFWVLMTFPFRYFPQAPSVHIAKLKSAASRFLILVSWRGFVGVASRFRNGSLKGHKLFGCKLVIFFLPPFVNSRDELRMATNSRR